MVNIESLSFKDQQLEKKYHDLKEIIAELDSAAVAFSGGVDSTLLLKVTADILTEGVIAVTSKSETYPQEQQEKAQEIAAEIGVEQVLIYTEELASENFAQNSPDRCYHCKKELFNEVKEVAQKRNITTVLDGSNYDDIDDYRPGLKALKELSIRSPLLEAKLNKKDIRKLSKKLKLPTWDKASFACLSSRFPYGDKITSEKLLRVDAAEKFLRDFAFKQLRVRHHDNDTARIEVLPEDMEIFLTKREEIVAKLKELGYTYITLDLEGYRTGSMNEVLSEEEKLT